MYLIRIFLSIFFAGLFVPAISQTCNNWLFTPSQPSYVDIGDLDVSGNKLTVECNFYAIYDNNGFGDLVSKHKGPVDVNYLLRSGSAEITTTNGYFSASAGCRVEPNRIYHAAMVYDGSTLRFYRNGYKMAETPVTGNMVLNDWKTWIGYFNPSTLTENFLGYINEVRIWNVARTQEQIRAYMNNSLPSPATQTGLIAYYTFDNLLNKQGNPTWNGSLGGAASINGSIANCTFIPDSCQVLPPVIVPNFTVTDTVCVNTPVTIRNNTVGATNQFWSFCAAPITQAPVGLNMGNINNQFTMPVFMDYVRVNNKYYGFSTNYSSSRLVRLDFGNSLLNTPVAIDLGNPGGVLPDGTEGIQIVQNEGRWYAIIVGGSTLLPGSSSKLIKLDFGTDIENLSPQATDWGNIGNLDLPVDLHLFQEGNNWYGFTINAQSNTVTRFNFGSTFNNIPTGNNFGNLGNLSYPTGLYVIKDKGNHHVFIANAGNNTRTSGTFSITRLDFGTSFLNTPTGVNLGNPGNLLQTPRDLTIMRTCGGVSAFVVNAHMSNTNIVRLDFGDNLASVPSATSLGNLGNLNFPHSISRLFREGNDIYGFILNVDNRTMTRLRFEGCSDASIPSTTVYSPPPISYANPGIYNIALNIDDGLLTQATACKTVVVLPALVHQPTKQYNICDGSRLKIGASTSLGKHLWSTGERGDSIYISTSGYYWVETDYYGCSNRDSFYLNVEKPPVQASSDQQVCAGTPVQLQATGAVSYLWTPGNGLSDAAIANPIATVSTTTRFIVTGLSANGCEGKDTVWVNIYNKPTITKSRDTAICKNTSVQIWASGGTTYSWSPANSLNDPLVGNPIASPASFTRYRVDIRDVNGCLYHDSVDVSIRPDPVFKVSAPTRLCLKDTVQLLASGGDQYTWAPAVGLNNPLVANPLASPTATTDFSVTISESVCGQRTTLTTRITVLPLPDVNASKSNNIDCVLDRAQLNATGAVRYEWSPAATLSNPGIRNPLATPRVTTSYIVKGVDGNGCHATDTITVKVEKINEGGYLLPNAFTPNNDGLNDCFGIKYWGIIEKLEFSIYNRWGERVFHTTDPQACWDGRYKGIPQNAGAFVYMIRAKTLCAEEVFRKGTFLLIR